MKQLKMKQKKKQKGGFLPVLLSILGASLLGSVLTSERVIRAVEGVITAGHDI